MACLLDRHRLAPLVTRGRKWVWLTAALVACLGLSAIRISSPDLLGTRPHAVLSAPTAKALQGVRSRDTDRFVSFDVVHEAGKVVSPVPVVPSSVVDRTTTHTTLSIGRLPLGPRPPPAHI